MPSRDGEPEADVSHRKGHPETLRSDVFRPVAGSMCEGKGDRFFPDDRPQTVVIAINDQQAGGILHEGFEHRRGFVDGMMIEIEVEEQ